ncbi:MAG: lytic transglycosylase domain-containing protein [Flavisolibacter sp.]|nr:lytic transglycosylase domain-containing protein [Flavisolibacter sp.]
MKKLLLFVGSFSVTLLSYSADIRKTVFNDSLEKKEIVRVIAKDQIIANPRAGFKNLFISTASTPGFKARLNPKAITFVQSYMQRNSDVLNKMKSWGKPYFDMMDEVLTKHGLPDELKYLSVIESFLKPNAVSWAGAVGPWQLMPETAKGLGLRVNRYADERRDFTKSTHAAARYLTYLYGLFNDWLLVIAAYNGGPGKVNMAIQRSGSRNFWDLQKYLPEESRNHVKKFIATHYIMEGEGGITTLTKSEAESLALEKAIAKRPQLINSELETISISGKYSALVIAQQLGITIAEFNSLNPDFDKKMALDGTYDLRLPSDKALHFQAAKPQILEQSIRLTLSMTGK